MGYCHFGHHQEVRPTLNPAGRVCRMWGGILLSRLFWLLFSTPVRRNIRQQNPRRPPVAQKNQPIYPKRPNLCKRKMCKRFESHKDLWHTRILEGRLLRSEVQRRPLGQNQTHIRRQIPQVSRLTRQAHPQHALTATLAKNQQWPGIGDSAKISV